MHPELQKSRAKLKDIIELVSNLHETINEIRKENLILKKRFDDYMRREVDEYDIMNTNARRIRDLEDNRKFDPSTLNFLGRILMKLITKRNI